MLTPIDFNDHQTFHTAKIHNVISKRVLAAEFDAMDLSVSESHPQDPLRIGLMTAQLFGEFRG